MRMTMIFSTLCLFIFFGGAVFSGEPIKDAEDLAQLGLAKSYNNLKKYSDAETVLRPLYQRYPDDKEVVFEFAKSLGFGGKPREAADLFKKLEEWFPDDLLIARTFTDMFEANQRFDEARGRYEELLKREPENTQAMNRLAELLALDQRYDEAIALLKDLLIRDPKNKEKRLWLARIYSWSRRYPDSLAQYEQIIKEDPAWVLPRREKARILGWMRRYKLAIEEYENIPSGDDAGKVAGLEKNAKDAFYRSFDARAISGYGAWLKEEPDHLEALFDLAQVYSRQRQWEEARGMYDKALALLPSHFRAEEARRKVAINREDVLVDSGFESYEADSGSRDVDEKYYRFFNSLRFPVRKDAYLKIAEETFLYSFSRLSSLTRQRLSLGVDYRPGPSWGAEFGDRYSFYSDGVSPGHNYHGALNLTPVAGLNARLFLNREDVTDNAETVQAELRRNNYGSRVVVEPNRRIGIGADYVFSDYNDGNMKKSYGVDFKGTLFYEPRSLTLKYRYESYGFDEPRGDYFTPSSFHTNSCEVEWRHYLNTEELFWGARDFYYTLRYTVKFDVHDQHGHVFYAGIHKDWTDRFSGYLSWQKEIYEHRENYSQDRLEAGVRCSF